jgi:MOSC domain-containing protein YiiM
VTTQGRVLQVGVSNGGVPKHAVPQAWVGELGLEGDRHREDTVHGGPYRAVCLFSMEAIERLQAEGHPVEPGSVGENLTTSGIEWAREPGGRQARIGSELVIELVDDATPCDTQRPNFIDGRFKRISRALYPDDARMYACVITPGTVHPGDSIELLPLPADHDPKRWTRLFDIDWAEIAADMKLWTAARDSGLAIDFLRADELAMASSAEAPEPAFNHALGMRTVPELLPRLLDFYRKHGTPARFGFVGSPWPGAERLQQISVLGADVTDLQPADEALPDGVTLRWLGPDEAETWAKVVVPVFGEVGFTAGAWERLLPHMLGQSNFHRVIAEIDGEPVGTGSLSTQYKVGLLRSGLVLAAARGRGIQRALVRARVQRAIDEGCEIVAAHCGPDSTSERNLAASGLRRLWVRDVYGFDPWHDPAPWLTERAAVA